MRCLQKNVRISEVHRYATCGDFQRIFSDDRDHFYLLAFLLTADHEKAEQCLVAGLADSVAASQVFREWARSWAKRAVIQNAIRAVRPHPGSTKLHFANSDPRHNAEPPYLADFQICRLLELDDFKRSVFVVTVLERYSDQDASALIGCTAQQVREGRLQALEQISAALSRSHEAERRTSVH